MIIDIFIFEQMGLIKTGINWKDKKLQELMKAHSEAAINLANSIQKCPPHIFNESVKKLFNE